MVKKEYQDKIIQKMNSEDYYVMQTSLNGGAEVVDYILPYKSNFQDFQDYWVQSATGLSTEDFIAYNKLSKEEKEQIAKLAKINVLRKQLTELESSLIQTK